MDVEEIVERTGGFGRLQAAVVAFTFVTSMFAGAPAVQDTFINYTPDYRCYVPSCDAETPQYNETFLNFTIPRNKEGVYSQCDMYQPLNHSSVRAVSSPLVVGSKSLRGGQECQEDKFDDTDKIECPEGYVYDDSLWESSATTEFDFTCSRSFLAPFTTSAYTIGMLFGSVGNGFVSDYFGRKRAHLLCLITYLVGAIAGALSVNTVMLIVFRALAGVGATAMFNISFVIVVEFMPIKHRTMVGMAINMVFAVGEALVGVAAIYVRQWRTLQLIISVPSAILFLAYWYIPESLRWLVNQKKYEQAEEVAQRIARINGAPRIENLKFKEEPGQDDDEGKSVLDLLRSPTMRAISINMFYIWFASNMVYYGSSQNSGNLSGNIFVNFIAIMLIEIPSYMCVALFMDRLGHKTTLFFMMLVATVACLTCGFLPTDATTPIVVLSLIGKFGGAGCFGIVYVYATEIFPTSYRSIGVGACSMFARLSGIFSPMVASLGHDNGNLPLLIFGCVAAISLVSCLFQPETVGMPLPQTLEECEALAKSQGMFDFLKCGKKPSRKDVESSHSEKEKQSSGELRVKE